MIQIIIEWQTPKCDVSFDVRLIHIQTTLQKCMEGTSMRYTWRHEFRIRLSLSCRSSLLQRRAHPAHVFDRLQLPVQHNLRPHRVVHERLRLLCSVRLLPPCYCGVRVSSIKTDVSDKKCHISVWQNLPCNVLIFVYYRNIHRNDNTVGRITVVVFDFD